MAATAHVVALIAFLPLGQRAHDTAHRLASLVLTQLLLHDAQLLGAAPWPLDLEPLWQGSGGGLVSTAADWIVLAVPPIVLTRALPLLLRDPLLCSKEPATSESLRAALALSIATAGSLTTGLAVGAVALAASQPGRRESRAETAFSSLTGLLCLASAPAAATLALILSLGIRRPRYGLSSLVVGAALLTLVSRSGFAHLLGLRPSHPVPFGVPVLALLMLALMLTAPSLRGRSQPGLRPLLWGGAAVGALLLPADQALALPVFWLAFGSSQVRRRTHWQAWGWLAAAALLAAAPWARVGGLASWVYGLTAGTPILMLHWLVACIVAVAVELASGANKSRIAVGTRAATALAGGTLVALLVTTFPGTVSQRLLIWPPVTLEQETPLTFELTASEPQQIWASKAHRWLVLDGALATAPATIEPVVVVAFDGRGGAQHASDVVLKSGQAFDDWAARRDRVDETVSSRAGASVLTRVATRSHDGRPFLTQRYRAVVPIPTGTTRVRISRARSLGAESEVTLDRLFVQRRVRAN